MGIKKGCTFATAFWGNEVLFCRKTKSEKNIEKYLVIKKKVVILQSFSLWKSLGFVKRRFEGLGLCYEEEIFDKNEQQKM